MCCGRGWQCHCVAAPERPKFAWAGKRRCWRSVCLMLRVLKRSFPNAFPVRNSPPRQTRQQRTLPTSWLGKAPARSLKQPITDDLARACKASPPKKLHPFPLPLSLNTLRSESDAQPHTKGDESATGGGPGSTNPGGLFLSFLMTGRLAHQCASPAARG